MSVGNILLLDPFPIQQALKLLLYVYHLERCYSEHGDADMNPIPFEYSCPLDYTGFELYGFTDR